MSAYRIETNGSRTDLTYLTARWYHVGSTWGGFPQAYYNAHNDGVECRTAYMAGVMARAFGVDLSEVLQK